MDFILNKLKGLHISGASANALGGAAVNGGVDQKDQKITNERVKSSHISDTNPVIINQQIISSDVKEDNSAVDKVNECGTKLVSLNDILGGNKSGRNLMDNECGDNKNVEPNNTVTYATVLDRGDQISHEMAIQPIKLQNPLDSTNVISVIKPSIAVVTQSTKTQIDALKTDSPPKPQLSEHLINVPNDTKNPNASDTCGISEHLMSSIQLTPYNTTNERDVSAQRGSETNSETHQLDVDSTVQVLSENLLPIESKESLKHAVQEILNELVDTATTPNMQALKMTENSFPDSQKQLQKKVDANYETNMKSESLVSPEMKIDMLNKSEMVKKNVLTRFDAFESNQQKEEEKIAENVNKIEVSSPTFLPQVNDVDFPQLTLEISINQVNNFDSLAKAAIETVSSNTVASVNSQFENSDKDMIKMESDTNQNLTQIFCHPDRPDSDFQKLNSESKPNNDKIYSTLESAILNQILDQEYASNVIPTLVEQSNDDNTSSPQNENSLENCILNQMLEQNNFHSEINEIPESTHVEKEITSDFQISKIDVTSADNFIEFVDEIIDFALRKIDFLKINGLENSKPVSILTVPEQEEVSGNANINDFYDHCLFTPTVDPQNMNFPTLESFEIEELQAKVMEQVDALYLDETPIYENAALGVPENPKINELQAKAIEQAHALNLNENVADFMYLHSADNLSKPLNELVALSVNVDPQSKLPQPIAIAAVIEQPQSNLSTNQINNLPGQLGISQSTPFYLADPPLMCRSQTNQQSTMDTSQIKLSHSMNEVYFDKRLDITGRRSFRKERDQKMIQKSKKDLYNGNLYSEDSRENTQETQKLFNKDTLRDSLEHLNEINTESLPLENNQLDPSLVSHSHIEKEQNYLPEEREDSKDSQIDHETSLKDSLENLNDGLVHEKSSDIVQTQPQSHQQEDDDLIRDSLENLVDAVQATSSNGQENQHKERINDRMSPIKQIEHDDSKNDKTYNCNTKTINDITTVQQKGVQNDVRPSEENVIHNTTAGVQSIKNVTPAVLTENLIHAKELKDDTMSLDIINGGDKLNSNKYYGSVNDEPKIKTNFIMAEYRKPMGSSNGELEKIINEYESKEESLIRRLTEKEKTITKMTGVMEAYEKTIAEMIAEKEQLINEYEKKCVNLKSDADLNAQHLLSLEDTFADLHAKYERSKQLTLSLKTNEEELRNVNIKNLELLNGQEIRYEKMKSHAIGQLQIANEKLEHLQRVHAQETTKLKALLKREELARSSLTEQLQQKIRENEELVKICEELIGKE